VPQPSLRELQEAFWRHLALAPGASAGRRVEPALLAAVHDTPALGARERLDIYEGMYVARLVEALGEDFPRVAARLGPARFAARAHAYLARHPSEHPSIRHVGRGFADFIATDPDDAPPWLADLARLEWARLAVFDAADAPALTLADLRAVAPEDWGALRFRPVPAFAVLHLAWPAEQAWAAEPGTDAPALEPVPTTLRLWRDGFTVYHLPVDAREAAALAALVAGEPFATLCERLADIAPEEAAAEAGTLLVSWIEDGIVAADVR
jgi:hypothetical protein